MSKTLIDAARAVLESGRATPAAAMHVLVPRAVMGALADALNNECTDRLKALREAIGMNASGPVAPGSENGAELGTAGDTSSVE